MSFFDRLTRKEKTVILPAVAVVLALVIIAVVIISVNKSKNKSLSAVSSVYSDSISASDSAIGSQTDASSGESVVSTAASSGTKASEPAVSSAAAVSGSVDEYVTYTGTAADLSSWNLRLVNNDNTLPDGWSPDNITTVSGEYQVDSRIASAYKQMVAAAKADGIKIYPISAYRTQSFQTTNYNRRVERAKTENPSFSQAEAEAEAARHVARPRTSEHETGLSVDFNDVDETAFRNTAEAKWLAAHCNEYGFVIRYPEGKESVTGCVYEPWHLRFVGTQHAKKMTEMGFCLEEYINYLSGLEK